MPHVVKPEPTPNPNAVRFTFEEQVFGAASRSYRSPGDARGVAWAETLLAIPGVVSLFAVGNFVTVTKDRGTPWEAITPHVVEALAEVDLS